MAKTSFTKKIKVQANLDTSKMKKDMKKYESNFKTIFNSFSESFQQSTFGKISKKLKSAKLSDLETKKFDLAKEKAALRSTDGYYDYVKSQQNLKELETKRKQLSEIQDATPEQKEELEKTLQELKVLNNKNDEFNRLFEDYKNGDVSEEINQLADLFSCIERIEEITEEQKEIQKQIDSNTKSKDEKEGFKSQVKDFGSKMGNAAYKKLEGYLSKFSENLKKVFEDGLKEYKNISSYSLGTSLKINQKARDQALTYGLSDSQNYALTKAMEDLGANSMEDLYWMTPAQQERFSERIGYWSGQYEKIANEDSLRTFEELQREMEDMKSELQMYVVSFIADNKDLIIWALKTGVTLLQWLCNSISTIANWLGFNEKSNEAIMSDTINNYSTNQTSTTTVKIDNSFNGIDTENVAKLRKAGQEVNNQMINALRGNV